MSMTFEQAWKAYQNHYTQRPKNIKHHAEKIDDLWGVLLQYEVLLLDGFGVLNVGYQAIDGMPDLIQKCQKKGIHTFVLTNGATQDSQALPSKYEALGYQFAAENIISSRDDLIHYLCHSPALSSLHWGVISVEDCQLDKLPVRATRIQNKQHLETVEGFLFLGAGAWDIHWQNDWLSSLQSHPRPVLVANPDMCAPFETGFSTEPGFYACAVHNQALVKRFGKPFSSMYDLALTKVFNVCGVKDRAKILMVGDTLHTDILGANMAEIHSLLLTDWGFCRGHDVTSLMKHSGIIPHYYK